MKLLLKYLNVNHRQPKKKSIKNEQISLFKNKHNKFANMDGKIINNVHLTQFT